MNKREARDILFTLVYEYEFNREKSAADIYDDAREERGFENFRYIKKGLSDIVLNRDRLSQIIEKYADGWKMSRIAPVTRSILLVAAYDIVYKSVPCGIAINEAVELGKKYDEASAVPFINGILNSISADVDSLKADILAEVSPSEEEIIADTAEYEE